MKIIVVGIGKVGYTVLEQLSSENHDITAIDIRQSALSDALCDIDVIGIEGNGASRKVLDEAGVSESDLVIALTGSDETNLLCCLLASKLGTKGTIARVRNPEYNDDLELIKDNLGLSMTVNPEKEAAAEILRIFKFPNAMNVDIFSKGKIDLISFAADGKCNLCNRPIKESFSENAGKALICAVERGEDVFIPSGEFIIEENDTIAVLAAPSDIIDLFKNIGLHVKDIDNTMIIGGGRIAHYLANGLEKLDMNTTIIEKDPLIAQNLSSSLPNVNVICGDGTNRSLLVEEGISDMDAICCLTGFDEENILLSLYAKNKVPGIKTISKVNKTAFQEVTRSLNIGSVIYPKYTTANLILQHVRAKQNNIGSNVETLYKIIDNKVEAIEFHVSSDSELVNTTLEELTLRENVLIGCINRSGKVFIPHGKDMLYPGDSVVVVTKIAGLSDLDSIRG